MTDTQLNTNISTRIVVSIESLLEIPQAYQKAISQYQDDEENYNRDIWDAKIELKQVNFQKNFRRSEYECVFEITQGEFLEGYKRG